MKALNQIFQYIYLAFAVFFLYNAYNEYASGGTNTIFFILIAFAAVAMFFFKRHMMNKMNGNK